LKAGRLALVLSCGLAASRAYAQCSDGLPPPCRRPAATTQVAAKTPAINPRLWIVVPFGNVMHAQDLDWLRDASVNLLSLDMSRWTDVSVVPDKRVSDLLREMARSSEAPTGDTRRGVELVGAREVTLTLNDGLAIARRAGAGMLVMGDVFKLGNGARLTATVFDVRTGRQVRSVTRQASAQDSLLSVFGPLARGVLDVPPPADAKAGDAGTQNLAAYQEYLAGVKAYNRFDLPEAEKRLLKAIALDSTFALAHLEYSLVQGWGDASIGTKGGIESRTHALLAQRFGTNLPKRERMLIDARAASVNDDNSRACEIAGALVAQDSTDVESLYLLGECSYHDMTVDPSPSDPRIGKFRGSWNTAIRSFTRILELDPGFFAAFEPFADILQASQRGGGCPPRTATNQCVGWHSFVLRDGDSLLTIPSREGFDSLFGAQSVKAAKDHVHLINLGLAKSFAKRWFDADTTSEWARVGLARTSLAYGDLETAYAQLVRLPVRATQDNYQVLRTRLEVAAKLGHGAEARAMFDSLVKAVPDAPGIDVQRGSIELMFGRLTRYDRGSAAAGTRLGPEAVAYQKQIGHALLGLPRDEMALDEAAFFKSMSDAGCALECRLTRLQPTLMFFPHVPVGVLASDSVFPGNNFRFAIARLMLATDTAKLHEWARSYELGSRNNVANANQEFGFGLLSANLYLVAHDSASALRTVRFFVDSAMTFQFVGSGGIGGLTNLAGSAFWPRAMLLRADLAAAAGQREEAKKWYERVLDLWADADADFAPTIARIRAALAAGK
jgi:tetratricopeptide (TPR) repeat protein